MLRRNVASPWRPQLKCWLPLMWHVAFLLGRWCLLPLAGVLSLRRNALSPLQFCVRKDASQCSLSFGGGRHRGGDLGANFEMFSELWFLWENVWRFINLDWHRESADWILHFFSAWLHINYIYIHISFFFLNNSFFGPSALYTYLSITFNSLWQLNKHYNRVIVVYTSVSQ